MLYGLLKLRVNLLFFVLHLFTAEIISIPYLSSWITNWAAVLEFLFCIWTDLDLHVTLLCPRYLEEHVLSAEYMTYVPSETLHSTCFGGGGGLGGGGLGGGGDGF